MYRNLVVLVLAVALVFCSVPAFAKGPVVSINTDFTDAGGNPLFEAWQWVVDLVKVERPPKQNILVNYTDQVRQEKPPKLN